MVTAGLLTPTQTQCGLESGLGIKNRMSVEFGSGSVTNIWTQPSLDRTEKKCSLSSIQIHLTLGLCCASICGTIALVLGVTQEDEKTSIAEIPLPDYKS